MAKIGKDINNLSNIGKVIEVSYEPEKDDKSIIMVVNIKSKYRKWFDKLNNESKRVLICRMYLQDSPKFKIKKITLSEY